MARPCNAGGSHAIRMKGLEMPTTFCDDCDWQQEVASIEEGEIACQKHEDEVHDAEEIRFEDCDEWIQ